MAEECKTCREAQKGSFSKSTHKKSHHHHHHHHESREHNVWWRPTLTLIPLLLGMLIDYLEPAWWGIDFLRPIIYIISFIPMALPIFQEAWILVREKRDFFNECSLMSIASISAFAIGEYPEAVMIMLLYAIGEIFEGKAVAKAKRSIAELVDSREELVTKLLPTGETEIVKAEDILPKDFLRVVVGERLSLDVKLLSQTALVDLSALTGESTPVHHHRGDVLLAGSIVLNKPIEVEVVKPYGESTLARIISMAEEAADRRPPTERFIRRFSHVYTPIVTSIALLVIAIPFVWSLIDVSFRFQFTDWFYRALVFLVTSCPCALIISVPLGYFSGIGAASRRGLLFKGAHFLEKKVSTVVFDKTGTLTEGKFSITKLEYQSEEALSYLLKMEQQSSHPIAYAIVDHLSKMALPDTTLSEIEEIAGHGLQAKSNEGKRVLCGNHRLLAQYDLPIPTQEKSTKGTIVYLVEENEIIATVVLEDQIKSSSKRTIEALRELGIPQVVILSGDRQEIVSEVSRDLNVDTAYGGLLPQDKMEHVDKLMQQGPVLFVGDGLNDAPVMSLCDIGVAMGGIGSDITIEAADIVIQGDNPYKLIEAIKISKKTNQIVYQNITFALGFKFTVMLLALFGIASLPLAVLADVGVTLLTILNSTRILRDKQSS